MSAVENDGLTVTHSSERTGTPDLRLIHYNDVYHVEYADSPFLDICHDNLLTNIRSQEKGRQSQSVVFLDSNP